MHRKGAENDSGLRVATKCFESILIKESKEGKGAKKADT